MEAAEHQRRRWAHAAAQRSSERGFERTHLRSFSSIA